MHHLLIETKKMKHSVLSNPPKYECNPQVTVHMYCTAICFIAVLVPKASYTPLTSLYSGWQAVQMAEYEQRLTLTDLIQRKMAN